MEGLIFGILRYFGIDIVSRRLLKWISRIEKGMKLGPTTRHRTHSNQISTRLTQIMKVTKKVTLKLFMAACMTSSGRSVRDHDLCVCIPVILMVIRLNLICTYSKNRLIGVLIAIAYPFLPLRLHNYVLFYIFSCV